MSTFNLLYPAFQKFYSALNSLNRFSKEKNFFDNISSLDTFFSEFRNVTFVLQKSLANTQYISVYEKNRDKYLSEFRWFVEKRNEITKEHPFRLIKQIDITIYLPGKSFNVFSKKFTIEDDVEISTLIEKFKELFINVNPVEVFFSAKFSFLEKESNNDIWDQILQGIRKMKTFLDAMEEETNAHCTLNEKLKQEIDQFDLIKIPKDILMINDYVYYPKKDIFESAGRVVLKMEGQNKTISRMPLSCFDKGLFAKIGGDYFEKFVAMHVILHSTDLLPAIMIIYNDNTFELDAFNADIKTTMYRKINETANQILTEEVKEVYFMIIYRSYPLSLEYINMTAVERSVYTQFELMVFTKIDYELNVEEYVFDGRYIKCKEYISRQLRFGRKKKLDISINNMLPIIKAFKKRKEHV